MDYKKLLEKFIKFMQETEGVNLTIQDDRIMSDIKFTDEEWSELIKLSQD